MQNASGSRVEEEIERLSSMLELINERYGIEFMHADKIIDRMEKHMSENEEVQKVTEKNTYENFE